MQGDRPRKGWQPTEPGKPNPPLKTKVTPTSDLEKRLRERATDSDADLMLEAARTLALMREKLAYVEREQLILEPKLVAVREWAKQHRHRWPGTEVESCAKEVLAILDRSDTDEA